MTHRYLVWTPRAKQRPKTTFKNGHPRTFTPKPTLEAEAALARQWVGQPVEGPIEVFLRLSDTGVDITVMPSPEPTSPKLRRGDIDNYVKLILDALNGVAWKDDRQIVTIYARKT